jgi:hypothetical protein
MPAPYLLTCPPDLAQQTTELARFVASATPVSWRDRDGWTVGRTGAAGSGAPANSPLLPLDSAEHRLQATVISPICFA